MIGWGDPGYGEIVLGARGTGSNGWQWEWEAEGTTWWGSDHRITQRYGDGASAVFDKEGAGVWIACPEHYNPSGHNIAWGRYSFRFRLQGSVQLSNEFSLDLTDPRWALKQPYPSPVDLYIRAVVEGNMVRFEYKAYMAWGDQWKQLPDGAKIWELWEVSEPGPDDLGVLEPTPPPNFVCSNVGHYGEHPQFHWQEPEPAGASFRYKVYRRRSPLSWRCVASGLTDTQWRDEEVTIDPVHGVNYCYYATAATSQSVESEHSDEVWILGQLGKALAGAGQSREAPVRGGGLWVYPNPCNPVATVCYVVPEEGELRVALYSLSGKEVACLAEGVHGRGTFQVPFDGRSLSTGLYLVRLQSRDRMVSCKVLLVK